MLYTKDITLTPEQVEDLKFFSKEDGLDAIPANALDALDVVTVYKLRKQSAIKNNEIITVSELQQILANLKKGRDLELIIRQAIADDVTNIQKLKEKILTNF